MEQLRLNFLKRCLRSRAFGNIPRDLRDADYVSARPDNGGNSERYGKLDSTLATANSLEMIDALATLYPFYYLLLFGQPIWWKQNRD